MIESIRQAYNKQFSAARYHALLQGLAAETGVTPDFRVAETPVFVPAALHSQLQEAGNTINNLIMRPGFRELTEAAIPPHRFVPGDEGHPEFIITDFAVTRNENGELAPKLIELQGFPSLFGFQEMLARQYRRYMDVPPGMNNFGSSLDTRSYAELLRDAIVAGHDPATVILLEVLPQQQKTLIDFVCTEKMLGIPTVCVSDLVQEGRKLYYRRDDRLLPVNRIYNRMIAEDVEKNRALLGDTVNFQHELDVEWATHPNWYYRISKYLLPYIQGPFAPRAWFLHEIPVLPQDLHNYVLKPLFSFAGQGVIIDPTPEDADGIADPENWILQQKVEYAPVIATPTGPARCEIRLMYVWPPGAPAPVLAHNLARLSKGKMIGVNYNRDLDWVGGSSCFFE